MALVTPSGRMWLSYGQIYVESGGQSVDFDGSFRGQKNGLCGAVIPGTLCLLTGLHTGEVGFEVEVRDAEPPVDDSWEEIVEVSFRPLGKVSVSGLMGNDWWELDLAPVDYRVRYCGWGMDAGHQAGPPMDGEPLVDRYLLQLWPAAPAPEQILKVTSAQAKYWHKVAAGRPPPPTAEQVAEAKAQREAAHAERMRLEQLKAWGGTLPSERIRETYCAFNLVQFDRPLLDDLDHADDETLVAVARWSARQACLAAGLDQMPWVVEALDRMDRGVGQDEVIQPPPGAFGDGDGSLLIASFPGWDRNQTKPVQALLVIHQTYDEPLDAALTTLWMAIGAYGESRGAEVVGRLREAFPQLRSPVQ